MRLGHLVAATAMLAGSLSAHADTLYTSASAYAAVTSTKATVTFGTDTVPGGYETLASAGNPYSVNTAGGTVIFSTSTPGTAVNLNNANYYSPTAAAYPSGNYAIVFGATPADVLTINFPFATAFSLEIGGLFKAENGVELILSDGFTSTFSAAGYATSGDALSFLGITSSTPLTSISFVLPDDANQEFSSFDNVSYGAAATPEPSSFALLGTGLLGVAGVVRKRFAHR